MQPAGHVPAVCYWASSQYPATVCHCIRGMHALVAVFLLLNAGADAAAAAAEEKPSWARPYVGDGRIASSSTLIPGLFWCLTQ
jgi:hypothetical protein